jgi:hypothetical protein
VGRLPLLAGELERVAARRAAGVRHQDLDRPEVLLHALEQLGRGVEVERVVHVRPPADLGRRGLDLLPCARAHRHAGALARQLAGDREPDALRGARDERDLAVKPQIHARRVSASGCRVAPMLGVRLLIRATPFLLGALAAALWLRREIDAEPPLMLPPAPEPIDIVTVVDDLLDYAR